MFIYLLFYVVWQNYLNRGQANLIRLISEDVGRIFSNFFNIKNPFYRKKNIILKSSSYAFGDLSITKFINMQWRAGLEPLDIWGGTYIH